MKKSHPLLLVLSLLLMLSLCACQKPVESEPTPAITGSVVDAGHVRALCPTGWLSIPVHQIDGEQDANSLLFVKGASSPENTSGCPTLHINYYETAEENLNNRSFYTNTKDIAFQVGDQEWTGFTGYFFDYAAGVFAPSNDSSIEIEINFSGAEGDIALTDADFQAILASIQH